MFRKLPSEVRAEGATLLRLLDIERLGTPDPGDGDEGWPGT
jgi:hypothetical protein